MTGAGSTSSSTRGALRFFASRPESSSSKSPRGVRFRGANGSDLDDDEANSWLDHAQGILTVILASWCLAGFLIILVILYVTVRPFSQSTYRRLAAAWGASTFLDAIALLLPNCRICLTGDSDVPSPVGSSVLIANHVTEADWWAMFLLGRCVGLKGALKVFLRNEYLHLNMQELHGTSGLNGSASASSLELVLSSSNSNLGSSSSSSATAGVGGSTITSNNMASIPSSIPSMLSSSACSNNNINGAGTGTATGGAAGEQQRRNGVDHAVPGLALMAKLLHLFLEFPIINEDFASDREQLFRLLRSFGTTDNVHLLFYPEGWSIHNGADRHTVHQRSNQFAQREGKPALEHLLLPRARGFHAALECLREAAPVVYDVTMAYGGYDGSLPYKMELSLTTLWNVLRRKFPREIHLRIKRHSVEEVLQDSNWLFKKWAEKDRLLSHFARHQQFPMDSRYGRIRVFETRRHSLETSVVNLCRLLVLPCLVPFLLFLSIPLFWTLLSIWLVHSAYRAVFLEEEKTETRNVSGQRTPGGGTSSAPDTPFCPTTPFVSPSPFAWRDMFNNGDTNR